MTHISAKATISTLLVVALVAHSCESKRDSESLEIKMTGVDSVTIRWEIVGPSVGMYSTTLVQKLASNDPIHLRSTSGKEALMRTLSLITVELLNGRDPELRVRDSSQDFLIIVHRDTVRSWNMELVVITLENIGKHDYRIYATVTVERNRWLSYIHVPVFGDAIMAEYLIQKQGVWMATPCSRDSLQVEHVRTVVLKVLNRHRKGKMIFE